MSDTDLKFSDVIHWPEGIDLQVFLDQYWQKKPLLIRQAFPEFVTPMPADELAGLSMEPDTTARIITQANNGAYHLEHGPFDEERFSILSGNQWSLLVTDVDKHIPQFSAFLQPFRFISDWRIDDLMVSYAPEGASVGAHVDEYDVFLLQASGVRTWHIDARQNVSHQMRDDGDLKILANFEPTDTWNLLAGDMLYLPPGTAHHGIAHSENCTTWSVGFRAPRLPDLIARVAELLSDQMAPERYTDSALTPARAGEISHDSIRRFKSIWVQATSLNDEDFANLLGRWLTESSASASSPEVFESPVADGSCKQDMLLEKQPSSRFAWVGAAQEAATLFVDGESFACSQKFAQQLSASLHLVHLSSHQLDDDDRRTLETLVKMGCLTYPG